MINRLLVAASVILGLVIIASLLKGSVYKLEKKSERWQYIIIHHSATPSGNAAEFDTYHREQKGWDELAYHFVIGNGNGAPDGMVETGTRWLKSKHGAHAGNLEMNDIGIGICLVGNFEKEHPTPRQIESLKRLLRKLISEYNIPISHIIGHRQVYMGKKRTLCPGKNLDLKTIRNELKNEPK